jgi:hypothetical protein
MNRVKTVEHEVDPYLKVRARCTTRLGWQVIEQPERSITDAPKTEEI